MTTIEQQILSELKAIRADIEEIKDSQFKRRAIPDLVAINARAEAKAKEIKAKKALKC